MIEIKEVPESSRLWQTLQRLALERKPALTDLALFARQMYTMMRAGVPINRAIRGLAESTRNIPLSRALEDILDTLEAGRDLASGMARHTDIFSSLFISMVQVGEQTGRLDEALLQISTYLEQEKLTRDRIKSAMRYPLIVIVAIGIALTIINLFVIPTFARIFQSFHAELPGPTLLLIAVSEFSVAYWHLMLGALAGMVFGFNAWVRTETGRYQWDKYKLRIPIIGDIILRTTLGRFASAFAMAVKSGVPLVQALTVVAKAVDNTYIGARILMMRNSIERGDTLTRSATTTAMFTPLVLQMLAVGEETGAVDELMYEVAGYYEREVDYDLKTLSDAIEPILIVAVGIMVLILALGVFLPMWDLASAARGGR